MSLYLVPYHQLGSCSGLTVLSFRSNNLVYIPDEVGRIPRLRVLNLSDNKIRCLPYSLTRLKELQALWLSENQVSSVPGRGYSVWKRVPTVVRPLERGGCRNLRLLKKGGLSLYHIVG